MKNSCCDSWAGLSVIEDFSKTLEVIRKSTHNDKIALSAQRVESQWARVRVKVTGHKVESGGGGENEGSSYHVFAGPVTPVTLRIAAESFLFSYVATLIECTVVELFSSRTRLVGCWFSEFLLRFLDELPSETQLLSVLWSEGIGRSLHTGVWGAVCRHPQRWCHTDYLYLIVSERL